MLVLNALALLVCLAPVDSADTPVAFRWQLKPGDVFYHRSDVEIQQFVQVGGQKVEQRTTQAVIRRYAVTKKNADGSLELEQMLVDLRGTGELGVPGDLQKKLKGATFLLTLSPSGEITRFQGYEAFLTRLAGDNPAARQALLSVFQEEDMRETAGELFSLLPAEKIKKGDSWERKYSTDLGPIGAMNGVSRYLYVGQIQKANRSLEQVSFKATLEFHPPEKPQENVPFQIIKGTIRPTDFSGTLLFDRVVGRLRESSVQMKLTGNLTVSVQGQKTDMDLQQKLTITSVVADEPLQFKD